MRRLPLIALLAACLPLLHGCGGISPATPATSAVVVVNVQTEDGGLLGADATVICGGVRSTAIAAEGSVVLRNVPFGTDAAGTQPLTVTAPGYLTVSQTPEISTTAVTRVTVSLTAVDLSATGTVAGTITSSDTGTAVVSALVKFVQVSATGSSLVTGYTDNQGKYVIGGVPIGLNSVTIEALNYLTTSTSANVAQDANGGQNPALDATMVPGSAIVDVNGTVRDTFSQEVLAGVQVTLGSLPTVTTDANGAFTVTGVTVGSQSLAATFSGYDDYSAQVDILPGMSALTVNLVPTASHPPSGPYNLQGIVTLNGLPDNSGALVTAVDVNTSRQWGEVTTPASGEYTMFLPAGDYRLTVTYDTHTVRRTVTVPSGGRILTGIDFILTIQ